MYIYLKKIQQLIFRSLKPSICIRPKKSIISYQLSNFSRSGLK